MILLLLLANLEWARSLVDEVQKASFPELAGVRIKVRELRSRQDYFQARFGTVYANPAVLTLDAPEDGLRAIVAHELSHLTYYRSVSKWRLLRLMRTKAAIAFEKDADRQAIRRGYAVGLKHYREWLYLHVPATALPMKKRKYLTPAEIDSEARSLL